MSNVNHDPSSASVELGHVPTPADDLPPPSKQSLRTVKSFRHTRSAAALTLRAGTPEERQAEEKRVSKVQEHHSDAHKHAPKAPSLFTAMASAMINFLLQFGLSCAYGIIMFEDSKDSQHRGLGVKMNLCSAMIMGLLLAGTSKVGIAMGGPDLNPVVFLGMFVKKISTSIANQLELTDGSGLGCMSDDTRRLGGSSSSSTAEFCTGAHYEVRALDCDQYHAELRATVIFAVAISSLLLGLLFSGLGHLKMTRFIAYVPTNIMEAFLSCVGYKVFNYALKFCKYKPQQFVPAACVGVPLYFLKALHMGNPALVIPGVLVTPLAIFYGFIYGLGGSVYTARSSGWMFDKIENVEFYTVWRDGLLSNYSNINFAAWMSTWTDLLVMVTVVLLDCMLKMSSTESKIPVQMDKDYEISLYGIGNVFTTLSGSSVGYMQLKFNVINYGILGNVVDRRAGAAYALLCGVPFFWTTDMFNYLPRFFLSTLLFFAGSGFVVENLWGSRKYLSVQEWLQIFVILAIFIVADSLLYAVVAGGLITGATFILRYATIPCVAGKPRAGGEGRMLQKRSFLMQKRIQHIANSWLLVIHLKGYIFFGSAEKLVGEVIRRLEWQRQHVPRYQRLHWLIFDCSQLDGLDSSASKAFGKLAAAAKDLHLEIIWCEVEADLVARLKVCDTIEDDQQVSGSLTDAKNAIENTIQEYLTMQQSKWLEVHPFWELAYEVMRDRMALEPFEDIFKLDMDRFGCPWLYCSRMKLRAFSTLLWRAGELRKTVYLMHNGKVGMFTDLPSQKNHGEWSLPVSIHGRGQLLNHEAFCSAPAPLHAVAIEDGEVLCWTEAQWTKMAREQPTMATAVLRAILKQEEQDSDGPKVVCPQAKLASSFEPAVAEEDLHEAEGSTQLRRHTEYALPQPSPSNNKLRGEELAAYLRPLHIAKGIAELGLCTAPGTTTLARLTPAVSEHMEKTLNTAFQTYSAGDTHSRFVPADKVAEAFLYAGAFGAALSRDLVGDVPEADFLSMGKDLILAPLSNKQVGSLLELYRHSGRSLPLDRDGLAGLLRDKVYQDMSLEEVDDLVNFCCGPSARTIDEDGFIVIMSRFVRKYEREWMVLLGLRHVLQGPESDELNERLTPDLLVSNPTGRQFFQEEAEELLWSTNFGNLQADILESGLCIKMVLLALVPCAVPPIELPPHARKPRKLQLGTAAAPAPTPAPATQPAPPAPERPDAPTLRAVVLLAPQGSPEPPALLEKQKLVTTLVGPGAGVPAPAAGLSPIQKGATVLELLGLDAGHAQSSTRASSDDILLEEAAAFGDTPALPVPAKPVGSHSVHPQVHWGHDWGQGLKHPDIHTGHKSEGLKWSAASSPVSRHTHPFQRDLFMDNVRRQLLDVRSLLSSMEEGGLSQSKVEWPRVQINRAVLIQRTNTMNTKVMEEDEEDEVEELPHNFWAKLHLLLEHPDSGKWAGRWSVAMGMFIMVSVITLISEPLISPHDQPYDPTEQVVWDNFERFFTVVFSLEYLLRFIVARGLGTTPFIAFLKNPMNLCDIVAVMPWYLDQLINTYQEQFRLLRVARLLRLARLIRLGRLAKRSAQLTPIAVILVLTWGIFMKSTLGSTSKVNSNSNSTAG